MKYCKTLLQQLRDAVYAESLKKAESLGCVASDVFYTITKIQDHLKIIADLFDELELRF